LAIDATGTPTSPDNIPTYNTSVDNPSGKGLNNIVAAIQTALSNRLKLFSAPSVTGQIPVWDNSLGRWVPTSVASGPTIYRKTTAKVVNTTVATTDLLNGEITVAANIMGATGSLRLTAFGDWVNNSGGSINNPRFALLLGGTTIFDTGASVLSGTSATRQPWRIDVVITNTATGAQVCTFKLASAIATGGAAGSFALTTGEGIIYQTTAASSLALMSAEGYNTSAVDTTAARALVLNVTNASASANAETKLSSALVEVI